MTTILETARADNLLAEDYLNKLKLAIIKDLTTSQAQPNEQDSRPPEHQRTRGEPLTLPRRASKSPDRTRAPYEVVDNQPLNGRTSRQQVKGNLCTHRTYRDAAKSPPAGIGLTDTYTSTETILAYAQ
jgi:hypothetical protein